MIDIIYGFFGEDEGQGLFLQHYLSKISIEYKLNFNPHPWYSKKFKGLNNKGVDNGFRAAWLAGFGQKEYQLHCLFIGRDLDSDLPTARAEKLQFFEDKIADINRTDWKDYTVYILPMQCIEHWLLALKRKTDGRLSKDTRGLESIVNVAVKKELYDDNPRVPREQSKDELVSELASQIDIEWLAEMSPSFLNFHNQVEAFVSKKIA